MLSNHFFFQPILFSYKNETVSAGKIKVDQREKYRKKKKEKKKKKKEKKRKDEKNERGKEIKKK